MSGKLEQIDILLATYNGARYLHRQIDSLLAQTYTDWRLLVSDDDSQDATPAIIADYIRKYPSKIALAPSSGQRGGAAANFSWLLSQAGAAYIMFCDQDDVWLPEKIAVTLAQLKEMENNYGKNVPLLVHTDLQVVDHQLQIMAESFWRYQNLCPKCGKHLGRLLVQNAVTGCTMMINRSLKNLALPVPANVLMHDWWLALVAAALGQISYLRHPTILYRQHSSNDTGARAWNCSYVWKKLCRPFDTTEFRRHLTLTQQQARCLWNRYEQRMSAKNRAVLQAYIQLPAKNFLARRIAICRYGLWKMGTVRNIAMLLRI